MSVARRYQFMQHVDCDEVHVCLGCYQMKWNDEDFTESHWQHMHYIDYSYFNSRTLESEENYCSDCETAYFAVILM